MTRVDQVHVHVQALDDMAAQGHRPDVGVVNVLVDMLSRSGVALAQAKAMQLFQLATRQGQLRWVLLTLTKLVLLQLLGCCAELS